MYIYIYIHTHNIKKQRICHHHRQTIICLHTKLQGLNVLNLYKKIKKIEALKKLKICKKICKQVAKPKRPRVIRRKKLVAPSDKRASGCLAGKVEYTKEIIDNFGVVEEVYGPDGVTKIVSITFIYIFFHVISFFSRNLNHDIYIYSNIKLLYIYIYVLTYTIEEKNEETKEKNST